jgi:hypothetical protein
VRIFEILDVPIEEKNEIFENELKGKISFVNFFLN